MGTGRCKYCRKRGVEITQFDRHPDNTIIWNSDGEAMGICWECELLLSSTRSELLEAHRYLKDTMHMYVASGELISALPDEGSFNHKTIFEEIGRIRAENILSKDGWTPNAKHTIDKIGIDTWLDRIYSNLEEHVGYIVVAAARMQQETTPAERKRAAKSIFLPGMIYHERTRGMRGDIRHLEKEFGKWYWKV